MNTKTQTIKEYCLESYDSSELREIVQCGMASGFANLIYYHEKGAFYDIHSDEIWKMLEEDCEISGCKNMLELIGSFNGANNVVGIVQFKNLLCWYAVARACREIWDERDDKESGGK